MRIAILAAAVALAAGCSSLPTVNDLPLPGGADLGDHPYKVTAQFENVLNLVPQSAVKVNDVPVGRVVKVSLPSGGWTADVEMIVNGDVKLPTDAHARLEQSSLLGEKFVQLSAPKDGSGELGDGAVIPVSRTNRNTEVEEVFGAMSLLLNGGGLAQLKTIVKELNNAFDGNEPQIKSMLHQVNKLATTLDGNKRNITDALDGLNRLSATVGARKEDVGSVLDGLGPGLKVLEEQRGSMVKMLQSLERLSGVAVKTINRSKQDMIDDLKALEPTLRRLADAGKDLPNALEVLFTYPFTDAVLPAVKGDYLNTYLTVTAPPGTEVVPPIKPNAPAALPGVQ